LTPEFYI